MKSLNRLPEEHIRSRGGAMASEQFCRRHDLMIDFCENVSVLKSDVIDYIARMMQDADMTARISPVRVDDRFGDQGKVLPAGCRIRPVSSSAGLAQRRRVRRTAPTFSEP